MSYQRQKMLLERILSDYQKDTRDPSLAGYLIQAGVVLPEALTDTECSRAWFMGDEDGGQDFSPQAFRESLRLVAQRAFDTRNTNES